MPKVLKSWIELIVELTDMEAIVEVIPYAVFSRKRPIHACVHVLKGTVKCGMDVRVDGTQKVLGVITNMYENNERVLEGIEDEVYGLVIMPITDETPVLEDADKILMCTR